MSNQPATTETPNRPVLCVPFFGPPGPQNMENGRRWRRLLNFWRERFVASGSKMDLACICETLCPGGWPHLMVHTEHHADVVRAKLLSEGNPGGIFDYKAAMIITALERCAQPMLVVDFDAIVMHPPEQHLAPLANVPMAMAGDKWCRPIPTGEDMEAVKQRNGGVVWFGGGAGLHAQIIRLYVLNWHILLKHYGPEEQYLEQMTWSLVWHYMGRHELPAELNASHHVVGPAEQAAIRRAAIVHFHGGAKWMYLEGEYNPLA